MPGLFPFQDKLLHAGAYAVLGVLLFNALRNSSSSSWHTIRTATLLSSLYGLSDEFHQSFVPGRQADGWDWLADTTGALLGSILVAFFLKQYRKLSQANNP